MATAYRKRLDRKYDEVMIIRLFTLLLLMLLVIVALLTRIYWLLIIAMLGGFVLTSYKTKGRKIRARQRRARDPGRVRRTRRDDRLERANREPEHPELD